MKSSRPGILSVRAVNQYRRRDVIAYLSLRYYLHNKAATTDQWAKHVATNLVLTRTNQPYFHSNLFKEITKEGIVEHRPFFIPGANEALAEAALLNECANHPQIFSDLPCVYSYILASGEDRFGIFKHYFVGLRRRHEDIAEACEECSDGVVRYTDIKKFYPSINIELARSFWLKNAEMARLSPVYIELGLNFINAHATVSYREHSGILTGPMFSHFLANLVFRELDQEFSNSLSVKYFRYVDDITIVGESGAVSEFYNTLQGRLNDLGFDLHDDASSKSIKVSATDWLLGKNDFRESQQAISWKTFIGELNNYLLLKPLERSAIQTAFQNEGFRIPIHEYAGVVHESSFLERIALWSHHSWFREKIRAVSIDTLLDHAKWLSKSYEKEYRELIDGAERLEGYNRKRIIPKLRYRLGRLIYLATEDTLTSIYPEASRLPELHFHAEVIKAISSANIDSLLSLGTNAAQAAAQPLKAVDKIVNTTHTNLNHIQEQSLAVLHCNGVNVNISSLSKTPESEFYQFASKGVDISLMRSNDPFIQEISCLHGLYSQPRHSEILDTVFDKDEDLAFDAIDQLQQSY